MNTKAKNYTVEVETITDLMELKNELNAFVAKNKCNIVVFCKCHKYKWDRFLTSCVVSKVEYEITNVGQLLITIGYIQFRIRRSTKFHYHQDTINKIMYRRAQEVPLKEIGKELRIPVTSLRNIIKEQTLN